MDRGSQKTNIPCAPRQVRGRRARGTASNARGHAAIAWGVVITMRHRLVHDDFEIDLNVIWDTLKDDLPPMRRALIDMIKHEEAKHAR